MISLFCHRICHDPRLVVNNAVVTNFLSGGDMTKKIVVTNPVTYKLTTIYRLYDLTPYGILALSSPIYPLLIPHKRNELNVSIHTSNFSISIKNPL